MPFIITGQIRELESGIGVPDLRIEGWDRDLFFDDKIGECLTDTEGRFQIVYTEEDFRDLFERGPDIYLKVFAPNDTELHSTERNVRCESGREEHFDIDIPTEVLGEFSPKEKDVATKNETIEPKIHRRILRFLNAAGRPEDLMHRPRREIPFIDDQVMHGVRPYDPEHGLHAARAEESRREPLLDKRRLTGIRFDYG